MLKALNFKKQTIISSLVAVGCLFSISSGEAIAKDITYQFKIPFEFQEGSNKINFKVADANTTGMILCEIGNKSVLNDKLIGTGLSSGRGSFDSTYINVNAKTLKVDVTFPEADIKKNTHYKCALTARHPTSEADGLDMSKSVLEVSGAIPKK